MGTFPGEGGSREMSKIAFTRHARGKKSTRGERREANDFSKSGNRIRGKSIWSGDIGGGEMGDTILDQVLGKKRREGGNSA